MLMEHDEYFTEIYCLSSLHDSPDIHGRACGEIREIQGTLCIQLRNKREKTSVDHLLYTLYGTLFQKPPTGPITFEYINKIDSVYNFDFDTWLISIILLEYLIS